ncbi:MAG: hypothetical protein DRQ78_04505, partial [Epsilonproteobacteria bacterium]
MKHLFKPQLLKELNIFLIILLVVKVVWFVFAWLWLTQVGQGYTAQTGAKALYYRVKLTPNAAPAPIEKAVVKTANPALSDINTLKLLALYHTFDTTVLTVEYKSKTKVLSRGDRINGFVLEGGGSDFAVFSKKSKTYTLRLLRDSKHTAGITTASKSKEPAKPKPNKAKKNKPNGEVVDAGDHKIIDRALLDHYASNMDDIYKNIGITEVKNGSKIEGFRITFVKRGSAFSKLGVQRDDVIKSINGQEINSYNAAFTAYKNIGSVDNLTLVILRG